ncbi:MAG: YggS family pyridoxal phosphate-dependent enzyme, partial [Candidatus Omnitrophica bacterium]|nr:YggS family pyridoxal phosphate-dependent enzyme [Candidatus Omnitrophota bacterium]
MTVGTPCVTVPSVLREQLARVRERIRLACERCGRPPSAVTLVGVTKTVPIEVLREAAALGLADVGENRVQEAQEKQEALGFRLHDSGSKMQPVAGSLQPVRWHLIGHLQRNKAKLAVELFDVIHSIDSTRLVQELGSAARHKLQATGRPLDVFIQVNVSGESTKFGCRPEDAPQVAEAIARFPQLALKGLMTIAPYAADAEAARPHFRRLRELRDALVDTKHLQPAACSLSMGMSQ